METNSIVGLPPLPPQLVAVLASNIDGRLNNVLFRQKQMRRLHGCIVNNMDDIRASIVEDYGHSPEEVQTELCLALQEVHTHFASLDLKHDLQSEYLVAHGEDNWKATRGAGIIYIIPTTHTLFYSVIAALSASIAAGNCTIIELQKSSSRTSFLLWNILTDALDNDILAVCEERPSLSFLQNTLVVAQRRLDDLAAEGLRVLIPQDERVAAIVDRTANVDEAAAGLVMSRFAFGGRSPYAPDIVLVNEFCLGRFIEAVIKHAAAWMRSGSLSQDACIVTGQKKLRSLLDGVAPEDGVQTIVSGDDWGVVQIRNRNSPLLQRKFEGKFLILHAVSSLDDAINFSNSKDNHATYTFARLDAAKYVSESIISQAAWINHVPFHMLLGPALPHSRPLSPSSRYTANLFRVPHPKIVHPTVDSALVKSILLPSAAAGEKTLQKLLSSPPEVEQRPGHRVGFFEQGLISGTSVVLSFIICVSMMGVRFLRS
ncbi:aldehyde dehydrogenase PutA [Aspergillus welwitschiae]|uniref:Aldehyde dehydrogenase PutA n=1 Tax=Aspergillus welwitschiae TaxID=1341132 RepID=A0A3F3PWM0_9EURO|nr:aldehyde dehydrogenase PutA [Aspergillus welwitschiae]RDH31261.1 aldehyde dehydrogenase PutA [Aspergillus welwitschiae]